MLGPVQVWDGGRQFQLSRRQHRLLLGMLAIDANQVVSQERLIDLLWDERPPARARAVLQTRMSELRSTIQPFSEGPSECRLIASAGGYVLEIDRQMIDFHRFLGLVEEARASGSLERQRDLLRSALRLWHGEVLGGGLAGMSYQNLRRQIDAGRLTAAETLFETEIRLGQDASMADEVLALALQYPTREGLVRLALMALHRSGRSAEAVREYDRWRRWLADELGIDPSPVIQETFLSILRTDPSLADATVFTTTDDGGPSLAPSPQPGTGGFRITIARTLPPDIHDFAGRHAEVRQLRDLLCRGRGDVAVVALSGPGGVGKTALSVHVAHAIADEFPDGQLYVNLRAADGSAPISVMDVMGRFLRVLGIDGSTVPEAASDRTDLYRQLLADKRILLVLDNAASDEQVLPLIPASPGSAVIITSRGRLGAAIAADMIALGVLHQDEAVSLLRAIVGGARLLDDESTIRVLCEQCGRLPLALRIAGAKLRAKPHWTAQTLIDQLADERGRLDYLRYGHLDVRSNISLSYDELSSRAQRLLRYLGDYNTPEITNWVAAALLDRDLPTSESLLEQLVEMQVLEFAGHDPFVGPRYRMHDLVRLFAGERAGLDDGDQALGDARRRVYAAWLSLTNQAHVALFGDFYPNFADNIVEQSFEPDLRAKLVDRPLAWLETEQNNLAAMMRQLTTDDSDVTCWQLACGLSPLLEAARTFDDWLNVLESGVAAARRAGDGFGEAAVTYWLGRLWTGRVSIDDGWRFYDVAYRLFAVVGDPHAQAVAALDMAVVERFRGEADSALRLYREALPVLQRHGDLVRVAIGLRGIGQIYLDGADYPEADHWLLRALETYEKSGYRAGRAQGLFWLGMLRVKQGQLDEAEELLERALEICRAVGDRGGEAQTLRGIGLCLQAAGRVDAARSTLLKALQIVKQPRPTLIESYIQRSLDELTTQTSA